MKTTKIIEWYDTDTIDTIYIAANEYALKVNKIIERIDNDTIKVEISGDIDDIACFLEDLEEGDVDPFDNTRDMSDNDYLKWLSAELQKYGKLFIPTFYIEEEDDEV
jgi:hypothetical protein